MLKGTVSKLLQGRFVMGRHFQYMMPRIALSTTSCQHAMNETENIAKIGDFGNEVLFSDSSLLSPRNGRSVFIKSFGCSHNMSDGEYMAGLLHQGGYTITTHKEDADLWIINTCTVRDKSIHSFERYYKEAKQLNIPIVISGCMTQADKDMVKKYKDNIIVGVKQIHQITSIVDQYFKNESLSSVSSIKSVTMPPLQLPKVRKDKDIEIIPISLGCNGACTFCQTKLARGNLQSYPQSEIINRVRECKQKQIKEIWLTSEDVGAYGTDRGEDIGSLLESIQKEVEDTNIMIKIGMTNPPYIMSNLPAFVKALNHKNFYSYLHIPVQSGSDDVLRRMNRHYRVADFVSICDQLSKQVPGVTITTDIIVGFPGETAVDHHATMILLQNLHLDIIHYSKYYPRPHTIAATYSQLPREVVNLRVKELSDWFKTLETYEELKGEYLMVWVSNERMNSKRCCHSKNYVKVLVDDDEAFECGERLLVKCTETSRFHVTGSVVKRLPPLKESTISARELCHFREENLSKYF